jgi:hypothetical protein
MDRRQIVLAGLAPARGEAFTPVQVQKLFFLIDERAHSVLGGKHFSFEPYHYGPFDAAVYREIEKLEREGFAEVMPAPSKTYRLTAEGQRHAEAALTELDPRARAFIEETVKFVRGLSFTQLVSAIYRDFPEMKANSVFVD